MVLSIWVGFNRAQVKPKAADSKTGSRSTADLDELPSVYFHNAPPLFYLVPGWGKNKLGATNYRKIFPVKRSVADLIQKDNEAV